MEIIRYRLSGGFLKQGGFFCINFFAFLIAMRYDENELKVCNKDGATFDK